VSALITPDAIADEAEIIWLEPVDDLDYIRQSLEALPDRRRKPHYYPGRMVGYATLHPGTRSSMASGRFRRRVFWLKDNDRALVPDGLYAYGAPSEAVDPRTVAPGVMGVVTDRAWGGPPSEAEQKLGITRQPGTPVSVVAEQGELFAS
jgi:hypothetical protein